MPSLDLSPLRRVVGRLREGLLRYQAESHDEQLRDGLIQRFEFTYELSHRMLKRVLVQGSASPEQFDDMSFADLIRTGNQQGLVVGTWPDWRLYRELRGRTSHTYADNVALMVVQKIPNFLREAEQLLTRLEQKVE